VRLYGAERQSKMTPFAPVLRYHGRRQELNGLLTLISNVVDVRDPIQIAYDGRKRCWPNSRSRPDESGKQSLVRGFLASHREAIDCDAK